MAQAVKFSILLWLAVVSMESAPQSNASELSAAPSAPIEPSKSLTDQMNEHYTDTMITGHDTEPQLCPQNVMDKRNQSANNVKQIIEKMSKSPVKDLF